MFSTKSSVKRECGRYTRLLHSFNTVLKSKISSEIQDNLLTVSLYWKKSYRFLIQNKCFHSKREEESGQSRTEHKARQELNLAHSCLVSRACAYTIRAPNIFNSLDRPLLRCLGHMWTLLGQIYSQPVPFLARHSMVLTSPTSCGLHFNLNVTLTALGMATEGLLVRN